MLQAASLKKPKTGASEHCGSETASLTSDSNTFYEDDFSSSDDSSADEGASSTDPFPCLLAFGTKPLLWSGVSWIPDQHSLFTTLAAPPPQHPTRKSGKSSAERMGDRKQEHFVAVGDSSCFFQEMCLLQFRFAHFSDDDSEPILGQWFEETLSPEEPVAPPPPLPTPQPDADKSGKLGGRRNSADGPSFVPDRKEPDGVRCSNFLTAAQKMTLILFARRGKHEETC